VPDQNIKTEQLEEGISSNIFEEGVPECSPDQLPDLPEYPPSSDPPDEVCAQA